MDEIANKITVDEIANKITVNLLMKNAKKRYKIKTTQAKVINVVLPLLFPLQEDYENCEYSHFLPHTEQWITFTYQIYSFL